MGFLRRVLGGGAGASGAEPAGDAEADGAGGPDGAPEPDEDERARELELARFEQERVDDLIRRQQRYADRSWQPPAQGGERRADDEDRTAG